MIREKCDPAVMELYWTKLKEKTKKILQAQNISLLDTGIDEAVDFITEPVISFNPDQVSILRGFNKKPLVTHRDRYLLYTVHSRKQQLSGSKTIDFSEQWLLADVLSFFKKAVHNEKKEMEIKKYISIESPTKSNCHIRCPCFCTNARQLLAFKCAGLRHGADIKRHSLYWLAVRTSPPEAFYLEDYWYHEQETGVNLSVELAAVLDELFERYGKDDDIRLNWDMIMEIVYKCIEENYCDIAHIPSIDWKISVMKIACITIVEEMLGVFRENYTTKLGARLAQGIYKAGMFSTHRARSAFKGDPKMRAFASDLLKLKLSAVFNQILCLFTIDSFAVDLFSKNKFSIEKTSDTLEQLKKDTPHSYIVFDNGDRIEIKDPVEQVKGDRNSCEWKALEATLYEDEYVTDLLSETKTNKEKIRKAYGILDDRRNVLIFCDTKNKYVKLYLENVKVFLAGRKLFSLESDKLEIEQLAGQDMPGTTQDKRFIRIHQAIENAIKQSNCHAKSEE